MRGLSIAGFPARDLRRRGEPVAVRLSGGAHLERTRFTRSRAGLADGLNPELEDKVPLRLIRENEIDAVAPAVLRAARAHLSDKQTGSFS
jgi:hypothetical protein